MAWTSSAAAQHPADSTGHIMPREATSAHLQQDDIRQDAVAMSLTTDTLSIALPDSAKSRHKRDWNTWRPNPKRAMWLALVLPGAGQIYNRKYWKLPILYGGFVGLSYAITWNNNHFQDYFEAQKALLDDNPDNDHVWHSMLPYGQDPATADKNWFADVLKDRKKKRANRSLRRM